MKTNFFAKITYIICVYFFTIVSAATDRKSQPVLYYATCTSELISCNTTSSREVLFLLSLLRNHSCQPHVGGRHHEVPSPEYPLPERRARAGHAAQSGANLRVGVHHYGGGVCAGAPPEQLQQQGAQGGGARHAQHQKHQNHLYFRRGTRTKHHLISFSKKAAFLPCKTLIV